MAIIVLSVAVILLAVAVVIQQVQISHLTRASRDHSEAILALLPQAPPQTIRLPPLPPRPVPTHARRH